eukprot:TRINITY_DN31930_c0_g1_i1.p1 TRINITY_DN31930_c0_g1~~TRINITY_DN31930_c0_g1_i1.p1  ORF type:complete len:247 (-),score=29.52 TRINITY_DN31930_c0_g1_i1:2-742(-)
MATNLTSNTEAGGALTSDDYSIIDCNSNADIIQCGEAGHCMLRCNVDRCFDAGTLYASDSNTLTISANAEECMRLSRIYSPDYGNVNIYIGSSANPISGIFKEMTIYDGVHTNSITMDCSDPSGDTPNNKECRYLTINAQRSRYLKVIADDRASLDWATINCPLKSDYNGPDIAPCIIDASGNYVDASNMNINTLNGSPQDVIFTGHPTGDYTNVQLNCDAGTSLINGCTFQDVGRSSETAKAHRD